MTAECEGCGEDRGILQARDMADGEMWLCEKCCRLADEINRDTESAIQFSRAFDSIFGVR